jgi:hypothetical protein
MNAKEAREKLNKNIPTQKKTKYTINNKSLQQI